MHDDNNNPPLLPILPAASRELLAAASRNGTPIRNLQDAGGWSSPAMPRYAQAQEIANEGVILE